MYSIKLKKVRKFEMYIKMGVKELLLQNKENYMWQKIQRNHS